MSKLTIGYFYKEDLNLYGDNGNVEILVSRAKARSIDVEVLFIDKNTNASFLSQKNINLVFMGGGPDSGQKEMYQDLITDKKDFVKKYIEKGGVGLFVCGSYQLLGKYYKSSDGSVLEGLGVFDMYTQNFGPSKPRCIGNVVCKLSPVLLADPVFIQNNNIGDTLVGFENHGGRTYINKSLQPFATIVSGHGNNSQDHTEGVLYKNSMGTYLHGPILSKNPHLADFLIAKALGTPKLLLLNDDYIVSAHKGRLR